MLCTCGVRWFDTSGSLQGLHRWEQFFSSPVCASRLRWFCARDHNDIEMKCECSPFWVSLLTHQSVRNFTHFTLILNYNLSLKHIIFIFIHMLVSVSWVPTTWTSVAEEQSMILADGPITSVTGGPCFSILFGHSLAGQKEQLLCFLAALYVFTDFAGGSRAAWSGSGRRDFNTQAIFCSIDSWCEDTVARVSMWAGIRDFATLMLNLWRLSTWDIASVGNLYLNRPTTLSSQSFQFLFTPVRKASEYSEMNAHVVI